jgi:surfeit locus 1 family protein
VFCNLIADSQKVMTSEDSASSRLTRGEVAGTVLVLCLVALFGRLCLWQLHRLHERRASNAAVAARLGAAPLAAADVVRDTTGALYRRVTLHGHYDDAHSIILPARSYSGSPGVHVLTPFIISDQNVAAFVNRGWVPSPDAATIDLSRVPAPRVDSVTGLVVAFPGRTESVSHVADSTAHAGEFRRVWYAIDEASLRGQFPYPLTAFVVQLLPPQDRAEPIPKHIAAPPLDEGPHLSYAIQWFSFAVISIVGWIVFLMRRRSDRQGGRVRLAPPPPDYR